MKISRPIWKISEGIRERFLKTPVLLYCGDKFAFLSMTYPPYFHAACLLPG
jgi:hypothetical protein